MFIYLLIHVFEPAEEKGVSSETIIHPAEAEGLKRVLSTGDVRAGLCSEIWDVYGRILRGRESRCLRLLRLGMPIGNVSGSGRNSIMSDLLIHSPCALGFGEPKSE
jgi:hypothetical protein